MRILLDVSQVSRDNGRRGELEICKKEMEKDSKNAWWQPGFQLFLKLSGWIGGPIVIAVFLGKYLDKKYNTEPWLFLATVGVAFFVSMIALIKIGFEEFKKIEKESKQNKLDKSENNK